MRMISINKNPRIAIIGSVNSSRKVLEKLYQHNLNVVHVFGLDPDASKNVSGFNDLKSIAINFKYPFTYFTKLNTDEFKKKIANLDLDLLFVIGISQLIDKDLLKIPKNGCIGYHPTMLPKGRGRAAIAWIILEKVKPAATFFLINEGTDSGPIIAQESVQLEGNEYPQLVIDKILQKIDNALDNILPQIKEGKLIVQDQNEKEATYLGKRAPSDGLINWNQSAISIYNHIRSVSKPLPGAITFFKDKELTIWKSNVYNSNNIIGVNGRVIKILDKSFVVQTGEGLIEITEWDGLELSELMEGNLLGINFVTLYRSVIKNKK